MSADVLTRRERKNGIPQDRASLEPPTGIFAHGACRVCGGILHRFIDLGLSPLCDRLLSFDQLDSAEMFYPLDVKVCGRCWLAQHQEYVPPTQIYTEYANSSSVSESLIVHARAYVDAAVHRFRLNSRSLVVEIGSNDGYLLRSVVGRGIPCLGIEPARIVAREAQRAGIRTMCEFFSEGLAASLVARDMSADLVVANNCMPEMSDLHDFAAGVATLLKRHGVATFEVPHLMRLMERNQFDTIYHENLWYFSLHALEDVLGRCGLRVFDVEELATQGGSLRVFCCGNASDWTEGPNVDRVRRAEIAAGLRDVATYGTFGKKVVETKRELIEMLVRLKRRGDRIAAYGAPGKGCMLLNYCGIRGDILDYTVDLNSHKHGHYLPGTRIRVEPVDRLYESPPDWVLILPWNLEQEIVSQLAPLRARGTKFIVPIPEPRIVV